MLSLPLPPAFVLWPALLRDQFIATSNVNSHCSKHFSVALPLTWSLIHSGAAAAFNVVCAAVMLLALLSLASHTALLWQPPVNCCLSFAGSFCSTCWSSLLQEPNGYYAANASLPGTNDVQYLLVQVPGTHHMACNLIPYIFGGIVDRGNILRM